jgi:hypothetical protein
MGPRPVDFDEDLIRQSPTFCKWAKLDHGETLKYACRVFVKGRGNDDERLMRRYVAVPVSVIVVIAANDCSARVYCIRYMMLYCQHRIMIARRNNLKDHGILKQARRLLRPRPASSSTTTTTTATTTITTMDGDNHHHCHLHPPPSPQIMPTVYSDDQVKAEMDVIAVRKTRSYRHWEALLPGETFLYNQLYTKGLKDHDWLLQKNIWRRMRYRRDNKKLVQDLVLQPSAIEAAVAAAVQQSQAAMAAALLADPDRYNVGDHPDDHHHHHAAASAHLMCSDATIAQVAALDAPLDYETFRAAAAEPDEEEAAAAVNGDDDDVNHHHDVTTEQQQHDDDNDNDAMLIIATTAADVAVGDLLGDEVPV